MTQAIHSDIHDEDLEQQKIENALNHSVLPRFSRDSIVQNFCTKGDVSNYITFTIMILGILLKIHDSQNTISRYILATGLFGFAGGITNWLAVKMLFDHVPGLIGSGVIPRQFKAIRSAVKEMMMEMFFDQVYLEEYIRKRSKGFLKNMNLSEQLSSSLSKPETDQILIEKFTKISTTPEGAMINMIAPMCGGVPMMVPMLKPMLISFGAEMSDMLVNNFDPLEHISIQQIQDELDSLMTEKLLLLTPQMVKTLMENVIRFHLGWLVVWGNVFGALIGLVSEIAGYGSR